MLQNNKTIVVISYSNLKSDARVRRQIIWLCKSYKVIAIALGNPEIDGVEYIAIKLRGKNIFLKLAKLICLKLGLYWWFQNFHYDFSRVNIGSEFKLVIANDIDSVILAEKLSKKNKIRFVLDLHEYAPKEFEESWFWRFTQGRYKYSLCKKFLPKAIVSFTVNEGIALEYQKVFGIKPKVVTNAPDYVGLVPQINNDLKIKLIHHGAAIRSRKIEQMIDALKYVKIDYCFTLMLVPNELEYYNQLVDQVRGNPQIEIVPAVPTSDVVNVISKYDVGLYLLEPTNFNNQMALPNKFFDFIQARLAVVVSPSPEMARIIRQYDLGIVAKDYSVQSLADALNALTPDKVKHYKNQANKVAKELSATGNEKIFMTEVNRIMENSFI